MTRPAGPPALTRESIDSLATYTWVEATEVGRMAFALAGHPEGGPAAGQFAHALGLDETARRMPYVGERVTVRGDRALLRLDACGYAADLAVGPRWAAFVAGGGPVALAVGLDPLPRHRSPDAVEAYLRQARLRMGTTRVISDESTWEVAGSV